MCETLSPGLMTKTSPPSSTRRTECVNWSLLVQVTFVPSSTVMSAGSELVGAGQVDLVRRDRRRCGAGRAPGDEESGREERGREGDATHADARRRSEDAARGHREDEDERGQVQNFAHQVCEQEDRPVDVVGHVADLGQCEEAERPTEHWHPALKAREAK